MDNVSQANNHTLTCPPHDTYFLHVPRDIHFDNFLLAMISINAVIALVASCSNAMVIYTISRTPSLQSPSNILILGLAVADLSVGVFSQPCYCLFRFYEFSRNFDSYCLLGYVYRYSTLPLAAISFLTLTAITGDRFLAIHLHLRYQEIVTTKRIGITLVFIWMAGLLFGIVYSIFRNMVLISIGIILVAIFLFLNTYFIIKLYLVIRRHSLQIQSQQSVQQPMNMSGCRKSMKIILYVSGAFTLCYIPSIVIARLMAKLHSNSFAIRSSFIFSETLEKMNGVLNPIIYCWRIEGIRNAAVMLLRQLWRPNGN